MRVFHVYTGVDSSARCSRFLRFGDDMQRQSRFARALRSVNLMIRPFGIPPMAKGQVGPSEPVEMLSMASTCLSPRRISAPKCFIYLL